MKKKLFMLTAALSLCLTTNAGYFLTTCGYGGMTIDLEVYEQNEDVTEQDIEEILIALNEAYCGKGSGKALYFPEGYQP